MAKNTKIEWATATWNPFIGCTKVSPACDNCYAERWAKRCGRDFNKVVRAAPATFAAPLKWKEPQRIFVCSLSDFFHEQISHEDRLAAFDVMADAPQHTYMLLTKRPERMAEFFKAVEDYDPTEWPNLWLGVTAENQEQADKRIPILLQVPAKVRFVSCEPLLGPVDLWGARYEKSPGCYTSAFAWGDGIKWVIAGGESGPHARPMHPAWARSLRDQCAAAGAPFLFKQWGEFLPYYEAIDLTVRKPGACIYRRVGTIRAGRLLDGLEHNDVPGGLTKP